MNKTLNFFYQSLLSVPPIHITSSKSKRIYSLDPHYYFLVGYSQRSNFNKKKLEQNINVLKTATSKNPPDPQKALDDFYTFYINTIQIQKI